MFMSFNSYSSTSSSRIIKKYDNDKLDNDNLSNYLLEQRVEDKV